MKWLGWLRPCFSSILVVVCLQTNYCFLWVFLNLEYKWWEHGLWDGQVHLCGLTCKMCVMSGLCSEQRVEPEDFGLPVYLCLHLQLWKQVWLKEWVRMQTHQTHFLNFKGFAPFNDLIQQNPVLQKWASNMAFLACPAWRRPREITYLFCLRFPQQGSKRTSG